MAAGYQWYQNVHPAFRVDLLPLDLGGSSNDRPASEFCLAVASLDLSPS
ncbi:hypothetical protein SynSYN20_02927 [Synechococcus sp. SYN20]|nr:hypothetical protein SynSYN20_02927 [Synechococcus sp. SYN20]